MANNMSLKKQAVIIFVLWFVWLVVGMIIYANILDLDYNRGLFMAVSVGYSIGWPESQAWEDLESMWFSTIYLSLGLGFWGFALFLGAKKVQQIGDDWFVNEVRMDMKPNYWVEMMKWRFVGFLACVILMATLFTCGLNGYNVIQGIYFSLSSLSAAGLVGLPSDANGWNYGLTAAYAAIGVPVMALALGSIVLHYLNKDRTVDVRQRLKQPLDDYELEMLRNFYITNKEGVIDKSEFLLMCMIRMGTKPELVQFLVDYFDELDTERSGLLSIPEMSQKLETSDLDVCFQRARYRQAGTEASALTLTESPRNSVRYQYALDGTNGDMEVDMGDIYK